MRCDFSGSTCPSCADVEHWRRGVADRAPAAERPRRRRAPDHAGRDRRAEPGARWPRRTCARGPAAKAPVVGITGTGGAGKCSLVDELVRRFLRATTPGATVALLSVDPSKRRTGGALLGDRIRMNAIDGPRVYMRSLATRGSHSELPEAIRDAIAVVQGRRLRPDHGGDQRHRPGRHRDRRPGATCRST